MREGLILSETLYPRKTWGNNPGYTCIPQRGPHRGIYQRGLPNTKTACSLFTSQYQVARPTNCNMVKLTTYNILIGMVVATGTFGYGFGFGVFISAIGQPGFYIDMKLDRACCLSRCRP